MLLVSLFACVVPPPQEDVPAAPVAPAAEMPAPAVTPVTSLPPSAVPVSADAVKAPLPPEPSVALGVAPPDFLLVDENPKSPTKGKHLSPKDYVGKVAGFYFTHAT